MKKKFKNVCNLVALFVIGAASNMQAQAVFVDKVAPRPDGMAIAYEKYKLPNGLTIIPFGKAECPAFFCPHKCLSKTVSSKSKGKK